MLLRGAGHGHRAVLVRQHLRCGASGRGRDGRHGSAPCRCRHHVYQSRSSASLAIESRALSRLTLANSGHVAYAWLTDADFAELDVLPEEAENLPDAIRVIGGIEAAIFLRQHATEVRVNLRSKTGADVGSVAAALWRRRPQGGLRVHLRGRYRHPDADPAAAAPRWRAGVSAKRGQTDLSGVLLVDKPSGMTSHDVVDRVRRATGERRVGHAGTLDPMATGLLVVLVGPATRLAPYLTSAEKTYSARIVFGFETDTDDADGRMTVSAPVPDELCEPRFRLSDRGVAGGNARADSADVLGNQARRQGRLRGGARRRDARA